MEQVSTEHKTTSRIIDAISNASYVFWKLSVGFRIYCAAAERRSVRYLAGL